MTAATPNHILETSESSRTAHLDRVLQLLTSSIPAPPRAFLKEAEPTYTESLSRQEPLEEAEEANKNPVNKIKPEIRPIESPVRAPRLRLVSKLPPWRSLMN